MVTNAINSNSTLASNALVTHDHSELVAKKSGGRSGGGSFKTRPSRSSSPQRNSPRQKSTPRRGNYNRRQSTSPNYNRELRRTERRATPVYSSYSSPRNTGSGALFFLIFGLLITGVLMYIAYRIFSQAFGSSKTISSKSESKIRQERDNDLVTVSLLQVALSFPAPNIEYIQQEFSDLSLNIDTQTEASLVKLMQESALILLRNSHAWTHVLASSDTLAIANAESAFDKLSIIERSKFSGETLSNIDGSITTKPESLDHSEDFASYVVVTLILGTADDQPLFTKINTEAALRNILLELSSMRSDYLMKFELLWTPQAAPQYLSDEELLMEYSNILPLV
ncbi:MAG: DUF1517 domain-containing protein [Cyanobacteria bacterium P01_G01_bin.67]